MIYKLQYWLKSELIETEKKEDVSEDFDMLLDKVKSLIDYEWYILAAFDYVRIRDNTLHKNATCFVVADSRIERNELTAQIEANPAYKAKGIDLIRTDLIKAYDLKKLEPTIK